MDFDSLIGEDQDEDQENQELPSGDEAGAGAENIFTENAEGEDGVSVPIKVEPKKRAVRNPRLRLTVDTLQGPRGIHTIEEYCKGMEFKGKGYEKQDLDEVLRRMQHWAHRMYPTYKFDDVLTNIERLGKKRPLQVHMSRYRLNMLEQMKLHPEGELLPDNDEDGEGRVDADEPFDEFDALLGEQIAISKLAPRTPAQNSRSAVGNYTPMSTSTITTPAFMRGNAVMSTPYIQHMDDDDSELAQPLPPTQPSSSAPKQFSAEQLKRIAENRRLAQERLRAKQQQQKEVTSV